MSRALVARVEPDAAVLGRHLGHWTKPDYANHSLYLQGIL
jgi:hypothetical protein